MYSLSCICYLKINPIEQSCVVENNCGEQQISIESEFADYSFMYTINESKFQACYNFNMIRHYVSKLFDAFSQSILRNLLCKIN